MVEIVVWDVAVHLRDLDEEPEGWEEMGHTRFCESFQLSTDVLERRHPWGGTAGTHFGVNWGPKKIGAL